MIAIETRYIGPTNTRGSRVVAETTDVRPSTGRKDRLSLPWAQNANSSENHAGAAEALARKLELAGNWYLVGETGRGYLWARCAGGRFFTVKETWMARA